MNQTQRTTPKQQRRPLGGITPAPHQEGGLIRFYSYLPCRLYAFSCPWFHNAPPYMTSCGYLTINPHSHVAMERRSPHQQLQQPSSAEPEEARVITDEGVESEETDSRRRSPYSSESTMSSSSSSSASSSEARDQERQAQQPARQQQPMQRRRPIAVRDGEITGTSSIPSSAIVRRRPLHQTLGENNNDDNFEVALSWHRNKRILLGRLMETAPHGKLSLVRDNGSFLLCFRK